MKIILIHISFFLCLAGLMQAQGMAKEEVNKQAQFIQALSENAIGRYDKGTKILEELYKEDRTNGEIAFELAKAYVELKEQSLVDKYAQIAIKNSPDNQWYLLFYGEYLMSNNQPESAIANFKKIIALEPNTDSHYDRLARAYNVNKEYQEAIGVYDQMEKQFGPIPEIILEKFKGYDLLKEYDMAIEQISRLVNKYPSKEYYALIQAETYLKAGNKELAKKAFQKVLEIDPSNTQANLALLGTGNATENENLYLRSLLPIIENPSINIDAKVKELLPYILNLAAGKDVELKDALIAAGDRIVQTHPNEAKAYAAYGDILCNSGNLKAAIKQYEKTLTLDDKVYAVWEQLLHSLDEVGDTEKLLQKSEESIDYFPNQAIGFYYYGKALTYHKKYKEANGILEEALMIAGSNTSLRSTIHTGFASLFLAEGNLPKAMTSIEKSLEVSQDKNPISYEVLGNYYEAKGDLKLAMTNWEKSITMGNNSPKLKAKIEANKS